MTRFREVRALVNLRALRELWEWGQCVEWVRWGAGVGKEVKGDATIHFSVSFLRVFLEVNSKENVFRSLAISSADESGRYSYG